MRHRAGLLAIVLSAAFAACQTAPESHTQLREYVRGSMGAPLKDVAESLEARGFQCEASRVEWATDRANYGCSRYNFDGKESFGTQPAGYGPLYFLNAEIAASSSDDNLLSYRTYESREARYGKR